MVWKNISELSETLCENTTKLAILNLLRSSGPKTLFQIMDTFSHSDLTVDMIDLEDSGLVCRNRTNEFEFTKFGKAFMNDLDSMSKRVLKEWKVTDDEELRGIASRTR